MVKRHKKTHKSVIIVDSDKFFIPNLPITSFEKVLIAISGNLVFANLVYPLASIANLPNIIRLALPGKGTVKVGITRYLTLCIPVLSVATMCYYSEKAKHPEKMKYPVEIDKKNAKKVYVLGKTMSRVKGALSQSLFLCASYLIIEPLMPSDNNRRSWLGKTIIGIIATAVLGYGTLRYMMGKSENCEHHKEKVKMKKHEKL